MALINEHKRLHERETSYWWHVGRRRILDSALREFVADSRACRILDIGCGAGSNALFLRRYGVVTGLDISEEALSLSKHKGFTELVLGSAVALPFPDNSFDIISLLDVIEHIENDEEALLQAFRVLKNGGSLLLTVPAHPWLWSLRDEVFDHKRRYTGGELRQKLIRTGFVLQKESHFVILGVPFLLVRNMLRRVKKMFFPHYEEEVGTYDPILPNALNALLLLWLSGEEILMRYAPIPLGSSLLAVATKPSPK